MGVLPSFISQGEGECIWPQLWKSPKGVVLGYLVHKNGKNGRKKPRKHDASGQGCPWHAAIKKPLPIMGASTPRLSKWVHLYKYCCLGHSPSAFLRPSTYFLLKYLDKWINIDTRADCLFSFSNMNLPTGIASFCVIVDGKRVKLNYCKTRAYYHRLRHSTAITNNCDNCLLFNEQCFIVRLVSWTPLSCMLKES